jgi:hypothetical protein
MRFRLVVLLATMSFCGVAQRGGGMPTGHGGGGGQWGSPMPTPPRFPGKGGNPWWGGGRRGIGPALNFGSSPLWFNTPLCASPLFPLAPDCSFGQGFNSGYYPPPPIYVGPTVNVVAPAPAPGPPPVAMGNGPDVGDVAIAVQTNSSEISQAVGAEYHKGPVRNSAAEDKCPPLIVLKTGGMYSITRYWIKGNTLYFETTAHDTLYAPRAQVDRIIPAR